MVRIVHRPILIDRLARAPQACVHEGRDLVSVRRHESSPTLGGNRDPAEAATRMHAPCRGPFGMALRDGSSDGCVAAGVNRGLCRGVFVAELPALRPAISAGSLAWAAFGGPAGLAGEEAGRYDARDLAARHRGYGRGSGLVAAALAGRWGVRTGSGNSWDARVGARQPAPR